MAACRTLRALPCCLLPGLWFTINLYKSTITSTEQAGRVLFSRGPPLCLPWIVIKCNLNLNTNDSAVAESQLA